MENAIPIHFEAESKWLGTGELRLNASSYSPEATSALLLLDKIKSKGISIDNVRDLIDDVFYPPRFKRFYSRKGKPFLSSKDIFDLLPEGKRIKNVSEEYLVKPSWILVTRSGSVGRVLIANEKISKAIISEHVIRVITNNSTPIGYLYAYLISKIGQALIIKNIFGGVVDEIEPHHISSLPIPRIPRLEKIINERIMASHQLRQEAQTIVFNAVERIYTELDLPKIDEDDIVYLGGNEGRAVRSFHLCAKDLNNRLDASFHVPVSSFALSKIKTTKKGIVTNLGDVAKCFVPPRFKRAYVNDFSEGIPLLQGTHIPQIKPQDVKFIWNKMKNLSSYIVKKNWILSTCSGTIGRTSLVRDYWSGWTATNHLLRIVSDGKSLHIGYLTAFLLSKYGQVQFQKLIYGGVVDEIGEAGELFNQIIILKPTKKETEEEIGEMIFLAFDKRDKANLLEKEAVLLLERELDRVAGKEGK